MNKFNVLTIAIGALLSTQSFAANKGFDVETYGKVGGSMLTDGDKDFGDSFTHDRLSDDFRGYEDSKAGVILNYGFNKNFSVNSEIKGHFQGEDFEIELQELYFKAEKKGFDAEIGRMRTPLYMNSTIQDDDFSLNTYRGVRGFSTERTSLETFDGVSLGITEKLQAGKLELRGLVGISKDRDYGFYNSNRNTNDDISFESENIWQVEGNLSNKFGKFRLSHLEADTGVKDFDLNEFESTAMGYSLNTGTWFIDVELAKEESANIETEKGYTTLGYTVDKQVVPSLTYSQVDTEGSETLRSVELGIKYTINKNVIVKTAYENIDQGDVNDNVFSLGVAFKL